MRNETRKDKFDLDYLLRPANAFKHPQQVVEDPDLTTNEKRAILASWASDACAVEAVPELRQPPHAPAIRFDDIMVALRALDGEVTTRKPYRKFVDRARRIREFYRGGGRQTLAH